MSNSKMVLSAQTLEHAIRNGIPISSKMDFKVCELTEQFICVSGGAKENTNVHDTAFAGSLYSICTLAAWGLTFSKLPEHCSLVMEKANIEYLRPVKGEIIASAEFIDNQAHIFLNQLAEKGKARIELQVKVMNKQQLAVTFTAHLHVKK